MRKEKLPPDVMGNFDAILDGVDIQLSDYKRTLSGKGLDEIYKAVEAVDAQAMQEVGRLAAAYPAHSGDIEMAAKEELGMRYRSKFPEPMEYGECLKHDPADGDVPARLRADVEAKVIKWVEDSLKAYSQEASMKGNAQDMVPMVKALLKASREKATKIKLLGEYPRLDASLACYFDHRMNTLVRSYFPGIFDEVFEKEKPAEPEPLEPGPDAAKKDEPVVLLPPDEAAKLEAEMLDEAVSEEPLVPVEPAAPDAGEKAPGAKEKVPAKAKKVSWGRVAAYSAITTALLGAGYGMSSLLSSGQPEQPRPPAVAYMGENVYKVLGAECRDRRSADGSRHEGTVVALKLLSGKGKEIEGTISFNESRWEGLKKRVKEKTGKAEPTNDDVKAYLMKCSVEFDWKKYKESRDFDSIKFLE